MSNGYEEWKLVINIGMSRRNQQHQPNPLQTCWHNRNSVKCKLAETNCQCDLNVENWLWQRSVAFSSFRLIFFFLSIASACEKSNDAYVNVILSISFSCALTVAIITLIAVKNTAGWGFFLWSIDSWKQINPIRFAIKRVENQYLLLRLVL